MADEYEVNQAVVMIIISAARLKMLAPREKRKIRRLWVK